MIRIKVMDIGDNAEQWIKTIEQEQRWPSMECLYYQVQNSALMCGSQGYQQAPTKVNLPSAVCSQHQSAIQKFSQQIEEIKQNLDNESNPSGKMQRDLTLSRQLLNSLDTPLQEGDSKKMIDILKEAGETLQSSTNPVELIYAQKLKEIANNYQGLKSTPQSSQNTEKVIELTKMISGIGNEKGGLNTPLALSRYLEIKNNGTVANGVQDLAYVHAAVARGNEMAENLYKNISNLAADQRSLDLALDAMVSTLKPQFTDRLEQLDNEYEKSKKLQTPQQNLGWLTEMLNLCVATQGMSYMQKPENNLHSRLNLSSKPHKVYKQACEKFKCPSPKNLFLPFAKDDKNKNPLPVQFQKYQCDAIARLPAAQTKLINNIKEHGSICGQ